MTTLELDRPPGLAQARDRTFTGLRAAMPPGVMDEALRCSGQLLAELPHQPELERNLVLVAFGGGKDSSYTLAFVRAMQLILDRVHGRTFRMITSGAFR